MSIYVSVQTQGRPDLPEVPDEPFTGAFYTYFGGEESYGSMPVEDFASKVEQSLKTLYRSAEWVEYVRSGEAAWEDETLRTGGFLSCSRTSPGALEEALLRARDVIAYARKHNLTEIQWG